MSAYPLFCIDRGIRHGESRYLGPFQTQDEAEAEAKLDVYPNRTIRRCRRVLASELGALVQLEDLIHEELEDNASCGGGPSNGWARWDDELVESNNSTRASLPKFEEALGFLLRKYFATNIFVCEGDDDPQE